jgi:hypothetical protein
MGGGDWGDSLGRQGTDEGARRRRAKAKAGLVRRTCGGEASADNCSVGRSSGELKNGSDIKERRKASILSISVSDPLEVV